ncbi:MULTISPECIES: hypothetical protein [unclassified Micromonospora]|uniref:hypothetical protein n=1 Tax=unclassified Micromonospora TaxID=2617518 RepID=UPI001C24FB48|nr:MULTISPECIES: hypothetical protein [unclassified Micromonospora]MBU8861610.1 hypothetical protein [Micromonospora sp. WMMB482]MDM4781178.1 hypothetical protein [Micromonospora sp. b486]
MPRTLMSVTAPAAAVRVTVTVGVVPAGNQNEDQLNDRFSARAWSPPSQLVVGQVRGFGAVR